MYNFNLLIEKVLRAYITDFTYVDSCYFIKTDYKLIRNLLIFLKNHSLTRFDTLYDLSAYVNAYVADKNKFTVYYYLFSVKYNSRLIVVTQLLNELSYVSSISNIFKSSI